MGRHKDFACPQCGFGYRVNAAHEVDKDTNARIVRNNVTHATCPNCRYTASVHGDHSEGQYPSYSGDRILANKLAYQFQDPRRWDVVLFKYPLEAKTNFIKRLVGLPGETISIHQGDLFTVDESGTSRILRKPPDKLLAMRQLVYDDDYPARELTQAGFPERWQVAGDAAAPQQAGWQRDDESRAFQCENSSDERPAWIPLPAHRALVLRLARPRIQR